MASSIMTLEPRGLSTPGPPRSAGGKSSWGTSGHCRRNRKRRKGQAEDMLRPPNA